jgi:thiosulfate/3-mercaptopyruvate sulfurtransferase
MPSPLVSPEELSRSPQAYRLIDARPGPAAYAAGHLAGAVHADLNRDLSDVLAPGFDPARGGRHPLPSPERFARTLGAWGIGEDTPVAVYDDQAGANAAARAWWMVRALGHERAFVVDGGFAAAVAAGVPVTTDIPAFAPVARDAPAAWTRPTVAIDDVARLVGAKERALLDVRSRERFRGESETIDPVAGHIPGAINLPYAENLAADGRYKPADELRAMYTQLLAGLPPERLILQCGSGVTACHTLLALEAAGLPGSALYVGSWSEWCRSDRPQARGD